MLPIRGLERTRLGRLLISTFVVVAASCMVVANLPRQFSAVRRAESVTHHVIDAVGLYQPWRVFSPPRTSVIAIEARVTFDDGMTTTWRPPRGNALFGSYADYHWQKFVEHAGLQHNGDDWPRLREPLARYVADSERGDGRAPVRVTLIARTTRNLPLDGDGPSRAAEETVEYYTLDLTAKEPA